MIYVLLVNGFEEIEAIEPVDIMRRAGLEVKTVSIGDNFYVTGAHNICIKADINVKDIVFEDMEVLVLPGGPGHIVLDNDENVHRLIDYAVENDKYVAAICAAPSIVGKKGLLKGRKATAFPGYEKYLKEAELSEEKAVVDGKFITARGAGAAADFGFMIVSELLGKAAAEKLKGIMQY